MIFASDLDRTLIYSQRAMGLPPDAAQHLPVELYNGEYISYMSKKALSLLQELQQFATFVPVTTRTVEQYKRIFHISSNIKPKYAITSNGGNILMDGEPDPVWATKIRQLHDHYLDHEALMRRFREIASPDWVLREYLADNLFYTVIIDWETIPLELVRSFGKEIAFLGWSLSIQGRKLYLIPAEINKGSAMLYIKDRLSSAFAAASGDSLLDESLLKAADYALAPAHGELYAAYAGSGAYNFTQESGIAASEEILRSVLEVFRKKESTREYMV
ncbi:hydrolase [Paenibacillus macerans]|uniref:HAD family hydrolase n=1 Tax=Paenibacillus macerans TaxID=44252 RepID=UPI002040125F|nr:hydrolase [Paenibacillus macerans]MCM3701974.1 hydrolase [Paenibacillus macerans]